MNDNVNDASNEASEGMTVAVMNMHTFDGPVMYATEEGMAALSPGRIIVPADDPPYEESALNDAERGGFELLEVNPVPTRKLRFSRAIIIESSGPTPDPNRDHIAMFDGLTLYTAASDTVQPMRLIPSIVAERLGGDPIRSESITDMSLDEVAAVRAIYLTAVLQGARAEFEGEERAPELERKLAKTDERAAKVWMLVVGGGRHKVILPRDEGFVVTRKAVAFMEPYSAYTLEPISECQRAAIIASDPSAKPEYILTIDRAAYTETLPDGRGALTAGRMRMVVEQGTRIETRTAWLPRMPFDEMGCSHYLDTADKVPPKSVVRAAMRELVHTTRVGEV
jgi:hypothetical protein